MGLGSALLIFELLLLLFLVLSGLVMLHGSSGVPRPSVFIVSTLLARERLMLWDEILDGARPRSCRRRRYGCDCSDEEEADGLGFVAARWWWAKREEIAGPREDDEVESGFCGDGIVGAEALGWGSFSGEADRLD